MGYVVMASCIGSFLLASTVSPGVVATPDKKREALAAEPGAETGDGASDASDNASAASRSEASPPTGGGGRYDCYPHDGVVFVKGFCQTCRVPK